MPRYNERGVGDGESRVYPGFRLIPTPRYGSIIAWATGACKPGSLPYATSPYAWLAISAEHDLDHARQILAWLQGNG